MRRSESLRRFGRAGSAGVLAAALAASAAQAALPTGGMLLPRPKGPPRADLPAATALDVHRIPSGTAYGLADNDRTPAGQTDEPPERPAAAALVTESPTAAEPAIDRPQTVEPPVIRPRVVTSEEPNAFSLPDSAAPAAFEDDPFAEEVAPVPTDAWEAEPSAVGTADATYAGLKGICPVTLREERRVVTPRPELSAEFGGRRYEFATPEARAAFELAPERYAPALGGRDVVLAAAGEDAVGTLKHAGVFRGRLYLFHTEESCRAFYKNPRQYAVGE